MQSILPTSDYDTPNNHTLIFAFTRTRTLLDQRMIKREIVELASSLDHVLCHGCAKIKVPLLYLMPKWNIFQSDSVGPQKLWMQHTIKGFGLNIKGLFLYCDSITTSGMTKNSVLDSKNKHTEMKHHFIREHLQEDINIQYVATEQQLGDIFTKPL